MKPVFCPAVCKVYYRLPVSYITLFQAYCIIVLCLIKPSAFHILHNTSAVLFYKHICTVTAQYRFIIYRIYGLSLFYCFADIHNCCTAVLFNCKQASAVLFQPSEASHICKRVSVFIGNGISPAYGFDIEEVF